MTLLDEIIAVDMRFNKMNLFEIILSKNFQSHKKIQIQLTGYFVQMTHNRYSKTVQENINNIIHCGNSISAFNHLHFFFLKITVAVDD